MRPRFTNRRGYFLIEIGLSLLVMAIILGASVKLIRAYRAQSDVSNQQYKIAMLANSIKNNAKLIMDATSTVCTAITTSYANDGWGWRHPSCQNTSPFPVYNITTNILTYNIDTANFPLQVNAITNTVSNSCPYSAQNATTITFNCASLGVTGLQYKTSTGPTSNTAANTVNFFPTPHTNNNNTDFLNFLDFPTTVYIQYSEQLTNLGTTVSHYDMINAQNNPQNVAYSLDLQDLYLDRVKKTRDNMIALDAALKGYSIGNMTSEFENVPPNGLTAGDTFFVPWAWQALASSQANSLTVCNNSTTCSAIVSGSQWATAAQAATFADVWLLLSANILSGSTSYIADAFGNPLRIIPISNNCVGNVSSCVPSTKPARPPGTEL